MAGIGAGPDAVPAPAGRRALPEGAAAILAFLLVAPLAAQTDGFADPTFGNYGPGFTTIAYDVGGELRDSGQAVGVDRFGRILVAGWAEAQASPFRADVALARYLPGGTPDSNFNFGGQLHWNFLSLGFDARFYAVGELSDGTLVAAGIAQTGLDSYPIAALVSATGTILDERLFGGLPNGAFVALAVQPDDRIVLAGWVNRSGNYGFLVERLLPDFAIDLAFGQLGRTVVDFDLGLPLHDDDAAQAVALQKDGKILVAGGAEYANLDTDMAVARLTPAGALDPSFGPGGTGKATVFFDLSAGDKRDTAHGVAVDGHGRIVLAGSAQRDTAPFSRAAFARLDFAGIADAGFGNQGSTGRAVFTTLDNVLTSASGLVVQSDGKPVASGTDGTGTARGFAAARLTTAGLLDSDWGGGFGVVSYRVVYGGSDDVGLGVALQAGRSVLVGTADLSSLTADTDVALVRLDCGLIFADDYEGGTLLQWTAAAP